MPINDADYATLMNQFDPRRPRLPLSPASQQMQNEPLQQQAAPAMPPGFNGDALQGASSFPPTQLMPPAPPITNFAAPALGPAVNFAGDFGRPQQAPAAFNGGERADFAVPESMFPAGPPQGYRRMIMADGGPGAYQSILPGERTANGQDAMRQGRTMTEIQQANPGASPAELLAMRAQMQNAAARSAVQNFSLRNETANRNTGVMSNADSVAQRLAASTEHRNLNEVGANASRQRLIDAYIGQGRTPAELAEALMLHDQAMAHNFANPQRTAVPGATPAPQVAAPEASGAPPTANPPPDLLRADPNLAINRQLNQLLHQAMLGASVPGMAAAPAGPGQPQPAPSPLPATVGRSIGNDALTNFVTSLQTNNLMTPGNRAVLHRYITQNFPGHVNPWFSEGTRWSGLGHVMGGLGLSQPTPHEDAAKAMMDYLNQGGAGIGTAPNIPSRLLSLFNMEI